MNPIGEDVLKSTVQLRLENYSGRIAIIATVLFILATINIGVSIKSGEKPSIFWCCVASLIIIMIIGIVTTIGERLIRHWPYKVSRANTDVYFLNEDKRVELAKPGLYWSHKKCRLFKIESVMIKRAKFTIPCSYLCYVNYQVEFYVQPTTKQAELFLTWLEELESLKKKGHQVVLEKLQKSAAENHYPFKIYPRFDEIGMI